MVGAPVSLETPRFVRQRLHAILASPDEWGPPEAVELQVLLLVEILLVTSGRPTAYADQVVVRYRQFRETHGLASPLPLAHRLGLRNRASAEFINVLKRFTESELGVVRSGVVPFAPRADDAGPGHYKVA